ncbi:2-oxopent-4-enoate hydratase [Bacillus sp. OxB-1]|uniref:2-keto-4-pentenoate hydratase n=1 Tax=Bacillus sp. (strain OxB-1) TaxID=98228 RepID=UPI00058239EF|nr:fumarylacetoacetate hydrolase family protein [Bacillus sp. OxB-1]BAQ10976.1 2-oxopent-4-enoate hydratase [Bacillus sp. OxB-1]
MPMMVAKDIVRSLYEAERNAETVEQFACHLESFTENDAYDIQEKLIREKCRLEQTLQSGWKLGLTSKAKQQMMGVHEPSYGVLLKNMLLLEGQTHSLKSFIHPKLEPEIGFIFKRDITGPYITSAQIAEAIDYVVPAFELIDSRFERFKFTLLDAVADNSSSSRYILGNQYCKLDQIDLRLMGIVFRKNGQVLSTATSAAVMGNPLSAITWMANKLLKRGQHIKKGEVVLSGSLSEAISIKPGDHFSASFDGLGTIHVSFGEEA